VAVLNDSQEKIDHIISTSNISEFIEISSSYRCTEGYCTERCSNVVDAALSIKSIIASNDNAARAVFKILGQFSGSVGELIWVSPTTECDRLLDLIGSTAYVPNEVDPSKLTTIEKRLILES